MSKSFALYELQQICLPAAVGTIAIIYSTILGIFKVSSIRYADKDFAHPYTPWEKAHQDKDGAHYRGFKACQNSTRVQAEPPC